jgi:hypothetical protein
MGRRCRCCVSPPDNVHTSSPNLAIIVFTNLGSKAGLICKQQLRPVTTPKYWEAVSRSPTNKTLTYNGLHRFHTVDLSPQFRKGNFDVVCPLLVAVHHGRSHLPMCPALTCDIQ